MNPLSSLPKELLFHCITGHSNANRQALKIFISSGVKWASDDLFNKTHECWIECVKRLKEEWKICSETRISHYSIKWILNKPIFQIQTLQHLLVDDCSFKKDANAYSSPIFWKDHTGGLSTLCTIDKNISFLDFKHRCCINLEDRDNKLPMTLYKCPPIFYENGVFLLFNREEMIDELHFYPQNNQSSVVKIKVPFPASTTQSIHLLDGYIVFILEEKIAAISIDELKNSNTTKFLYRDNLQSPTMLKTFHGSALISIEEEDEKISFQMLYIDNGELKFSNCAIKGTHPIQNPFFSIQGHSFHAKSGHSVFLFKYSETLCTLGTISPDEPPSFHLNQQIFGQSLLIEYKDSVLLCSNDIGKQLQIQRIDILKGISQITPLSILRLKDVEVELLHSVFIHLDKLFLFGYFNFDPGYERFNGQNSLMIIDMATQTVENHYPFYTNTAKDTALFSMSLGKIHLWNAGDHESSILKIDYSS